MKLSSRTRYGIASLVYIVSKGNQQTSLNTLSKELDISKIYLEQIYSDLKKSQIVESIKGPTGGYYVKDSNVTLLEIFETLEPQLFEITEDACSSETLNNALYNHIYVLLDDSIKAKLQSLRLFEIAESIQVETSESLMYYI
ncbi:Rrf2 family transcriptional regulator [Erysipelothrix sp. HDW6A]|uniref:RrF2 family transcriptional regulator n=1 Tax=Erysipelothrix sp. HDW6A TaxID=2714928 RepID=UPI00140C2082|nr:Rrf2 family transcriptional regulator [Erysipelothrix sp. HDW6A]QIK57712.1 Rrf2 family transcriptional regulator [Erysipelothrix sp. HDW6A]